MGGERIYVIKLNGVSQKVTRILLILMIVVLPCMSHPLGLPLLCHFCKLSSVHVTWHRFQIKIGNCKPSFNVHVREHAIQRHLNSKSHVCCHQKAFKFQVTCFLVHSNLVIGALSKWCSYACVVIVQLDVVKNLRKHDCLVPIWKVDRVSRSPFNQHSRSFHKHIPKFKKIFGIPKSPQVCKNAKEKAFATSLHCPLRIRSPNHNQASTISTHCALKSKLETIHWLQGFAFVYKIYLKVISNGFEHDMYHGMS